MSQIPLFPFGFTYHSGSMPSISSGSLEIDPPRHIKVVKKKKCECGAEKTYGPKNRLHAGYCPKFDPGGRKKP